MVSGAVLAGVGATEGLFPHAFDEWFGPVRELGAARRRLRADRHPARQPGGHRRARATRRSSRSSGGSPPRRPRRGGARRRRPCATVASLAHPAAAAASQAPPSSPRTGISVALRRRAGARRRRPRRSPEGQLVGLIGPNGAGKTTFIDAIIGLRAVRRAASSSTGELLDGLARARARAARARADVAVDRAVRRPDRAARTSRSPPTARRCGRRSSEVLSRPVASTTAARRGLELLGLEATADAMPDELTQGQRKLVGVARALAAEPRLLCLDEPAAGLDTHESEELGAPAAREWSTPARRCCWSTTTWASCSGSATTWSCSSSGKVIAHGHARGRAPRPAGDRGLSRAARRPSSEPVVDSVDERRGAEHRGPDRRLRPARRSIRDARPDRRRRARWSPCSAPNGAGKTTTLRVISGLVRPMSGRIAFAGARHRARLARRSGRAAGSCTSPRAAGSSSGSPSPSTSASATAASASTRSARTSTSRSSESCARGASGSSRAASSRCSPSRAGSPAGRACCCSTSSRSGSPP